MNDELTVLAEAGAAAVVTAMATDLWQETRGAVVALFRPDRRRRAALESQLDGNAALVRQAPDPDAARRALFSYWTLELTALLRRDPAVRAALERLAAAVEDAPGGGTRGRVLRQTNTAHGSGTVFAVQQGDQHAYGAQAEWAQGPEGA
ncbi:hypothetical protein ACFYMX_09600 [Streptomyces griseofuscus]|uniref:hypothetical protein n=1 Tax=Streptomyces griseofuscus TaxID=146922 RepID=UPI00369782ED